MSGTATHRQCHCQQRHTDAGHGDGCQQLCVLSSTTDALGTLYNAGTLTVNNSTFANNETYRGGRHLSQQRHGAGDQQHLCRQCRLRRGGIYNRSTLTMTNVTFANNSATRGEGYYQQWLALSDQHT